VNKPKTRPTTKCDACSGSGKVGSHRGSYTIQCRKCRGRGRVLVSRTVPRQLEIGQLKLYVWGEDTNDFACALAHNVEGARGLIFDRYPSVGVTRMLVSNPKVYAEPIALLRLYPFDPSHRMRAAETVAGVANKKEGS